VPASRPAPGCSVPAARRLGWARRVRPAARPTQLVLALALALALLASGPRAARAGAPEAALAHEAALAALATAYTAAWNAEDLDAVVALFAADGAVRQRDPEIGAHGPTVVVRDSYGRALSYDGDPPPGDREGVTWAADRAWVRAWARPLLAAHHRVAATGHRVSGDTVTWEYQAVLGDARTPGVTPSAGTAELAVRGGQIAALTLTSDRAAVAAHEASLIRAAVASAATAAQAAAAPSGVRRRTPDTQGRGTLAMGPWILAAALSLAGVVVLAALKRTAEAP
jgi:hypothetical protein